MKYDYFNGPDEEDRRVAYAEEFTPEHQANGDDVQRRIGAVIVAFQAETGVDLPPGYASGWRSSTVNDATANAGKRSTHLTAQAGDKRDAPNGALNWWCLRNPHVLATHGLWMEHPAGTLLRAWQTAKVQGREPTPWCHLQSVPPASHNRVYFPDARAPTEWQAFLAAGGQEGADYDAWAVLQGQGSAGTAAGGNAPLSRRGARSAAPTRQATPEQGSGEET